MGRAGASNHFTTFASLKTSLEPYQNIQELFDSFARQKVVVLGDVMIDAYLWGRVDRISPEAPVPIVAVQKKENRPGGAANVAINILAMGAKPILCSVIGNDRNGDELLRLMQDMGMETGGMIASDERVTTVKTRVIGNNHQLLRVDEEVLRDLSPKEESLLLEKINQIIETHNPSVLIFEDYNKGVLSEKVIRDVIAICRSKKIPTAVDPKKKNFLAYKGVTLFKPNLSELKSGLRIDLEKTDAAKLFSVTSEFQKDQNIEILMVTLSEAGVFISKNGESAIVPAHVRNISDVSGAGDTVISVASLCMASGINALTMASIANLAGGLVCEEVGVVPISRAQLEEESKKLVL